ncbi:MAG: transcription antitermination factor NusB [bacterium]|nr:transcription antitermination factor NusB [bacterium]MXZ30567.1 transcription antitermination factor NusB [Acidimicrobiia bacterium]MDE0668262.1 transcription antitermination factor NusB [bacterium]MYB24644.1 transcription antitermination factor NusB [Acidimicrobiia bacterium]MYE67725.1 transcription antitermination factor NusB [Acidimicrobiia bacterium]
MRVRPDPDATPGARSDARRARERALALLYEAEARDLAVLDLLSRQDLRPAPLAVELIEGVAEHGAAIDDLLEQAAVDWSVARMAPVDRAILRIAAYELAHRPQTPAPVVLNEAVELADLYSTASSGRFVNGVLATVARRLRPSGPAG